METSKRMYETTFVVNASLDDPQIEAVIGQVQDLIVSNGGEITALNKMGRKRLAYPIGKKNNGFYVNIEFKAPAPLIAQLERMYQLDENIIRHLTIQLDKRALRARLVSQTRTADEATAQPAPAAETPEPLFSDDEAKDEK